MLKRNLEDWDRRLDRDGEGDISGVGGRLEMVLGGR